MKKVRVLFLCTHNSARSQMAEGWLRHLAGERFDVHSAGTEATQVRPLAVSVMAEAGVDISRQESTTLARYLDQPWYAVITVCDQANESCPLFPGASKRLHWSFPDPSRALGTEAEQLAVYRQVRDAIRVHVDDFLKAVATRASAPVRTRRGVTSARLDAQSFLPPPSVARAGGDRLPDPTGAPCGQQSSQVLCRRHDKRPALDATRERVNELIEAVLEDRGPARLPDQDMINDGIDELIDPETVL